MSKLLKLFMNSTLLMLLLGMLILPITAVALFDIQPEKKVLSVQNVRRLPPVEINTNTKTQEPAAEIKEPESNPMESSPSIRIQD